jgi:hypothetical protein
MRIREMREILKFIDDMPREEQLICAQKLEELWRDYDQNRFDSKAWWADARMQYARFHAAQEKAARELQGGVSLCCY